MARSEPFSNRKWKVAMCSSNWTVEKLQGSTRSAFASKPSTLLPSKMLRMTRTASRAVGARASPTTSANSLGRADLHSESASRLEFSLPMIVQPESTNSRSRVRTSSRQVPCSRGLRPSSTTRTAVPGAPNAAVGTWSTFEPGSRSLARTRSTSVEVSGYSCGEDAQARANADPPIKMNVLMIFIWLDKSLQSGRGLGP